MEKEKKDIKLKLITPLTIRRFTSKKLHDIVKNMSNKNEKISVEELVKNESFKELIKYAARKSLVNKSNSNKIKKQNKIAGKYEENAKILKEALEDELIGQKQYNKKMENLQYRINKEIYAKDLSDAIQEKPKNPRWQRIANNLKKIASIVGIPFVMIAKGVSKITRAVKVKFLTAEKIVKKVREMEQVVKETEDVAKEMKVAEKSKELNSEELFEKKKELYDNSSKEVQQEIYNKDYEKAVKENAKRATQRRESASKDAESEKVEPKKEEKETESKVEPEKVEPKKEEKETESKVEPTKIRPEEKKPEVKKEKINRKKDRVLDKYKAEGYTQNANGEYYNPWTDEYDAEYDPHKDVAYNQKDKAQREAKRRKDLHMDGKAPKIDHKEATQNVKAKRGQIEKVEGEILTPEEVKKVYGDLEK